jgi:dolichyl-phosphate-mannose-protein mannosyltransferase/tetratricopeptide repeat protein
MLNSTRTKRSFMTNRLTDEPFVFHAKRDMAGRFFSSNVFLAAILLLAFVLRLAHVLALRHLPLFDHLIVDSEFYDKWAQTIAAGDWMGGDRAFYYDPLYPYVLAVIYRFFGHDLLAVRLFQVALGVTTCGLVAMIGRRVGGRAVGNLAALMLAVYKPAIFQEGEVEKTALGVFLITAALLLVMRTSIRARLASGICLGLATLTRGNMLLLVPLGVFYLLTEPGNSKTTASNAATHASVKIRLLGQPGRSGAAFLLGVFMVLAPVAWRNHMVSGEWILSTSQAGTNFYTGNNPDNSSGGYEFVPFVRPQTGFEESDFIAEAEARTGRKMSPGEVSSFWWVEGLKHIGAHPGFAARMFLQKVVLFWSDFELPDAWDMYFLSRYSPVLAMPLLGMGLLLPLAVLGAFAGFRKYRDVRLLTGYIVIYSVSVVAFFVFSRYRIHIVPALVVLAAALLPHVLEMVRGRDLRRGFAYGAAAVLIAFFSFFCIRILGLGVKEYTQSYLNLAGLYSREGDFREAERLLEEALEKQHGVGQAGLFCALGELSLKTGNPQRAIEFVGRCVQLNPGVPNALMLLGIAYETNGMPDKAAGAYELQLRLVPGHAAARSRLEALRFGHP